MICRCRAVGSFYRRYGKYVEKGQPLDDFVEFTLKDDERGDPPITEDALVMLGILSKDEYKTLYGLTRRIASSSKRNWPRGIWNYTTSSLSSDVSAKAGTSR